jgi:hypothetical protein
MGSAKSLVVNLRDSRVAHSKDAANFTGESDS